LVGMVGIEGGGGEALLTTWRPCSSLTQNRKIPISEFGKL